MYAVVRQKLTGYLALAAPGSPNSAPVLPITSLRMGNSSLLSFFLPSATRAGLV